MERHNLRPFFSKVCAACEIATYSIAIYKCYIFLKAHQWLFVNPSWIYREIFKHIMLKLIFLIECFRIAHRILSACCTITPKVEAKYISIFSSISITISNQKQNAWMICYPMKPWSWIPHFYVWRWAIEPCISPIQRSLCQTLVCMLSDHQYSCGFIMQAIFHKKWSCCWEVRSLIWL